ncbi:hypothetical protein BH11PLA2_BH11PLA2_09580 [soil metagenome]
MYCLDKLCPKAPIHESMTPAAIKKHTDKYMKDGKKFEAWKSDPFTALIMYKQLKDAFGWEAFQKAFAAYHKDAVHPRGDIAKHDEFMVQMSLATGKNLVPLFEHWGIPITAKAKDRVAKLDAWAVPKD